MRAAGRRRSRRSSRFPTTSSGRFSPANSRMSDSHCSRGSAKMVCAAEMRLGHILNREFYARPTVEVARDLLGKVLVNGATAGIIVETEAYLGGEDLASHSARGITDRTRVIFGPPGHAYVYLVYGMYECLNIVAEPEGKAGCVLIRALEPVAGIEIMQRRRPAAHKLEDLASGPGKLT